MLNFSFARVFLVFEFLKHFENRNFKNSQKFSRTQQQKLKKCDCFVFLFAYSFFFKTCCTV